MMKPDPAPVIAWSFPIGPMNGSIGSNPGPGGCPPRNVTSTFTTAPFTCSTSGATDCSGDFSAAFETETAADNKLTRSMEVMGKFAYGVLNLLGPLKG